MDTKACLVFAPWAADSGTRNRISKAGCHFARHPLKGSFCWWRICGFLWLLFWTLNTYTTWTHKTTQQTVEPFRKMNTSRFFANRWKRKRHRWMQFWCTEKKATFPKLLSSRASKTKALWDYFLRLQEGGKDSKEVVLIRRRSGRSLKANLFFIQERRTGKAAVDIFFFF